MPWSAFTGFKGEVEDIDLVATRLVETGPDGARTRLQRPNSLFFQRPLRRLMPGR